MQHSTTTQQCSTAVQHSTTTQQCSTALHPPCGPPFLLTLESPSLAQTVSDLGIRLRGDLPTKRAGLPDWCANPLGDHRECSAPSSCRNSKTARNLFRVSVLCSAPSSSHCRGANPSGDRRECGRPPTCSELACCGRRPSSSRYRGASSGFGPLLESLSRCRLGVRHSPRVTIAVPTRPRVTIVVRRPPRVAIAGSTPWV